MSGIATIEIDGKKYEFPVTVGTENEVAIDINTLRSANPKESLPWILATKHRFLWKCHHFLDGEKGILRYRGYAIEELAEKSRLLR